MNTDEFIPDLIAEAIEKCTEEKEKQNIHRRLEV